MARASAYVALLRGINVGGHRGLSMAELRERFEAAGATEVRTYIQSGNVVFGATAALAKRLPKMLGAELEQALGYAVPIVVRSATQMASIAEAHPFDGRGVDPKFLHVAFLADEVGAKAAEGLDAGCTRDEQWKLSGTELYLYYPNGMARTKLDPKLIDRTLGTTTTARNWRTVGKLAEMAAQ